MTFTADSVRGEMRGHVATIVALAPGDSRKAAFAWAARVLGIPFNRVRSMFYQDDRVIVQAHEADQIRAYVQQAQELIEARGQYEKLRGDFVRDHPRLARLVPGALARTEESQVAEVFLGGANGTAEQVGPLAVSELRRLRAAGEHVPETLRAAAVRAYRPDAAPEKGRGE